MIQFHLLALAKNYPAVSGKGDTIAVVWEDSRLGNLNAFASISIDGGLTFSNSILLSDTSINTTYRTPHVAYADGYFHFVWKKPNTVFYKSMTLAQLLSVSENSITKNYAKLYPNPTTGLVTFESSETINKINVLDIRGKIVNSYTPIDNSLNVSHLVNGIYFIQLVGDQNLITKKLVKN